MGTIELYDCPHCNAKGVLPMGGILCPNCKHKLANNNTSVPSTLELSNKANSGYLNSLISNDKATFYKVLNAIIARNKLGNFYWFVEGISGDRIFQAKKFILGDKSSNEKILWLIETYRSDSDFQGVIFTESNIYWYCTMGRGHVSYSNVSSLIREKGEPDNFIVSAWKMKLKKCLQKIFRTLVSIKSDDSLSEINGDIWEFRPSDNKKFKGVIDNGDKVKKELENSSTLFDCEYRKYNPFAVEKQSDLSPWNKFDSVFFESFGVSKEVFEQKQKRFKVISSAIAIVIVLFIAFAGWMIVSSERPAYMTWKLGLITGAIAGSFTFYSVIKSIFR